MIHGPNLDLLGSRDPVVYGKKTLKEINATLEKVARKSKVSLRIVQSNHEGEIIDLIGSAKHRYGAILINPAAYTHTSVAIRDAIEAGGVPTVEVHLSNIYAREKFRQKSLSAPVCVGQISGFGPASYELGLLACLTILKSFR